MMSRFIVCIVSSCVCFFFQAEDGIRDLVRSRGLGDVYKRQGLEGDGLLFADARDGERLIGRCRDAGFTVVAVDLSLIHI